MRTAAARLALISLLAIAPSLPASLAVASPAAKAAAKPPISSNPSPQHSPRFDEGCDGTCTVTCDSGSSYQVEDTPLQCCNLAQGMCPDHSFATGSEWWPLTSCGFASIC